MGNIPGSKETFFRYTIRDNRCKSLASVHRNTMLPSLAAVISNNSCVNCPVVLCVLLLISLLITITAKLVHVGVISLLLLYYFFFLSCFLYCQYDCYKTVMWAASLMRCWLLWQPVAVFA